MIGEVYHIHGITTDVASEAAEEANRIWESPYTEKQSLSGSPRTYKDIFKHAVIGKLGEHFLKERFNYTDDNAKWHDLISPNGERTEVKTWNSLFFTKSNRDNQIRKLSNRTYDDRKWFFSTKLIIIIFNEKEMTLTIEGIYDI